MTKVKPGDRLSNPITGENGVLIEAPSEDNGRRLIVEIRVRPGGAVAGPHIHPNIEEAFTVLKGRVGLRLGDRTLIAPVGERFVCPAGTLHDWWNAGDEEAVLRVEITPGDRFLEMVVTLFGLANDGKTNAKGMPHPLQMVLFGQEFSDVLTFTGPKMAVLKVVGTLLAPIARWRGYRGSYPEHWRYLQRAQEVSA
ncbi:cupin domain-containing protein [Deinococcus apachensis]|uniref:cupin domain-containing protein n=1 Tax=Deinococcus apachensis TaxID=309886 RepID=UPI00035C0A9A|nr:cupin domain-containing protein [Deinococcus apachensis]